jgi:hypothetical protein
MVIGVALVHSAAAAPQRQARRRAQSNERSAATGATKARASSTSKTRLPRWAATESTGIAVELKISPPARATEPPPAEPPPAPRPQLELAPASVPPAPPPAVLPSSTSAPQPRAVESRERRWGLFSGGLALFLGGYALDIGLSYGINHAGAGKSLIPIVGPLVQMGDDWSVVTPENSGNPQVDQQVNQRIDAVNHAVQTAAYCVLAVDFALQLAGATMAVVGAVGRPKRSYANRGSALAWSVMPTGHGLAVSF